jgi:hypothetical protein
MRFYWFLLGSLAVWRVTHLLQAEDGPWRISARLRRRAGSGFFGGLLDCFYCLSLWVALPLAWWLGDSSGECLLLWPALSAAAILAERLMRETAGPPPAAYVEDDPLKKEQH